MAPSPSTGDPTTAAARTGADQPAESLSHPAESAPAGRPTRVGTALLSLVAVGNGAAVVYLWAHGGGISLTSTLGGLLTSMGRLTALVGTYLVLIQVVLLSRVPWVERRVGFDRLTVWHRRNGKVAVSLVVVHVPLIVTGYALTERISIGSQISELFKSYPGMVTATVGTVLLIVVVLSSLMIVRRRLPYETWYFLHITVYAGILLAYFHQIPTGNEFVAHPVQRDYWYALYAATVALVVVFRVLVPAVRFQRYRLHVSEVRRESPDVVSVYIEGRGLHRLNARGGQFFLWRFLTPGRWWQAHPFSLSAPPGERSLRITVKDVGGFSGHLAQLRPGTRVLAEGPFGRFTAALSRERPVALIAGGIGITPLRAMLDELLSRGRTVTVIHRAMNERDLVLRSELDQLTRTRGATMVNVVGDHTSPSGKDLLSSEHLRALIPDIAERDVYLCGPPGMMRHVRGALRTAGTLPSRIHSERFALAA